MSNIFQRSIIKISIIVGRDGNPNMSLQLESGIHRFSHEKSRIRIRNFSADSYKESKMCNSAILMTNSEFNLLEL